jgi:hypothetical protein
MVAVILVAAAFGGGCYYWLRLRPITNSVALLEYLPPSDSPLLYLNVATLRRGGILDAIAGPKPAAEAEYLSFVTATRFDYRRDLDAVLASFQGANSYYVIAGKFDAQALARYAESNGGACANGLCRLPAASPGKQISFYFLKPRLLALAVAPDEWAASLITPHRRPVPHELPTEPVWFSLTGSDIRKDNLPAGTRAFASALQGAEVLSLALGRDGGQYQALLRVTCRTPAEAAQLANQLTGATDTLRTLIAREKGKPSADDIGVVLTSGQFRQDDRRVFGRWPMPDSLLKNLAEGAL